MSQVRTGEVLGGALFMGAGLFVGWTLIAPAEPSPGATPYFVALVGLGLFGAGARTLRRALGPAMSVARVGRPQVVLEPNPVAVGEELHVAVLFAPSRAVEIEKIVVDLLAHDVTRRREDGPVVEQEAEVHSDPVELEGARLAAGAERRFSATIRVPSVWASVDGRLRWRVRIRVAYRGVPAWTEDVPVTVKGSPA